MTHLEKCKRCKGNGRIEMLEHCPECKGDGLAVTPLESLTAKIHALLPELGLPVAYSFYCGGEFDPELK